QIRHKTEVKMEASAQAAQNTLDIETIIKDILATIDREREQEIISRRFGLFDRKETLEQIGELLGITRERVRQLEKAVMTRLQAAASKEMPHLSNVEAHLAQHVSDMGNAARVRELAARLTDEGNKIDQARVAFLAKLSPNFAVVDEDDSHFQGVGIANHHDVKDMKSHVADIVKHIRELGEPSAAHVVQERLGKFEANHVHALATLSKKLATLNNVWGLTRWPTVNPKTIRDKIYLVLRDNGKPLHFSEISKAISDSDYKRKDVTTQAIHNELIKDKRFVLIGRGIYALKEWGYSKGTVADVISDVLREAGEPLHRDEIIKRVLKSRIVKETTILLNLQGKPQFKRVAKATYTLDEQPA
ncbi:MAG: sigma factor-like helix-turn-helix DNA-binding protein, partial [Patescibacteria group bacterium]